MSGGLITIPQAAALLHIDKKTAYRNIVTADDGTESLYGVPVIMSVGHKRLSAEKLDRVLKGEAA